MIVSVTIKNFKGSFFMYQRLLIVTILILCLTVIVNALPIHGEAEIYDNVVRLHVIANSDSEEDQNLKLAVRDAVLKKTQDLFKNCKTKAEAEKSVAQNLTLIEETARNTVVSKGYDYDVSVEIGEEEYPTKNYEGCCFPAGKYMSLRIKIGEAVGQNWWCVLFPPLCLGAASKSEQTFAQVGLSQDQYNMITQTEKPQYKIRFKILEAFGTK